MRETPNQDRAFPPRNALPPITHRGGEINRVAAGRYGYEQYVLAAPPLGWERANSHT
jgi:hypothetical protein